MLQLEHLTWRAPQGDKEIIRDLSLTIPDGKLVAVTGPNGGGKTTLAKLIAGLETPTGGRIVLNGTDITHMNVTERAQLGISYAFQQPVRFKGITVRDLLQLAAPEKLTERDLARVLLNVGLQADKYLDREVDAHLSGGEIKRVEIASVLLRTQTKLAVFDEPEAGIDLWSFNHLITAFDSLRSSIDGSLVVISHQERILSIADEIVIICDGRVQDCGARCDMMPQLQRENAMKGENA